MSWTYLRVASRTVGLFPVNDQYLVRLVLSNRTITPAGTGGGSTGDFPYQPGPPSLVQEAHNNTGGVVFPVTPVDGDLLVMAVTYRTGTPNTSPSDGWTYQGQCHNANEFGEIKMHGAVYTKTASSETNAGYPTFASGIGPIHTIDMTEWPAGTTFGQIQAQSAITSSTIDCGGTITPEANSVTMGLGVVGQFGSWGYSVTPNAGVTELEDEQASNGDLPAGWVAYKVGASSIGGTITFGSPADPIYMQWGGLTWTIVGTDADTPPASGQWVRGEIPTPAPDGSTTTFSTAFPYADGSLTVTVDGMSGGSVTEDGAAGTFAMAWAPTATETMRVSYQGR